MHYDASDRKVSDSGLSASITDSFRLETTKRALNRGEGISVRALSKHFTIRQKSPGLAGSLRSILKPEYAIARAVENISFDIEPGELIAFIGPNGAGKSSTIKMLTGILTPSSGDIQVLGFDPAAERIKLAFKIGTVFGQKSQLWFHLPPIDTFHLFARIYEIDDAQFRSRLQFLVDTFEIKDLLRTSVRKLSLGQRMKCEIVASLLHSPRVLFLDEPTIGLDVIAKQHVREIIKYLNEKEGVTIFLTSHDAGDVETLARRTIVINHGQLVFDDSTEKFKKRYIQTKIVELIFDGTHQGFDFPGGRVVDSGRYHLKIELDSSISSIEKLLAYALENFEIKDVNISDPSMEDIIARIYRSESENV